MGLPSSVAPGGLLALCMVLPIPAFAQQTGTPSQAGEEAAMDADFIELLEFLGEFSDAEGEWVDPSQFEGQTEAAGGAEVPAQPSAGETAAAAETRSPA